MARGLPRATATLLNNEAVPLRYVTREADNPDFRRVPLTGAGTSPAVLPPVSSPHNEAVPFTVRYVTREADNPDFRRGKKIYIRRFY